MLPRTLGMIFKRVAGAQAGLARPGGHVVSNTGSRHATFCSSTVCGSSDHAPSAGASITTQPWTAGARKSHQQQLDRQHRGGSLGVTYLHTALGLDTERALVERLATLWGVLPEVLQQRVQALGRLLQPAGRDAPAHALWMLVRSPGLRMLDEAQLRGALRRVAWLMRDLELSQPALLAAVYKRPWTLLAAAGDERSGGADAGALAPWRRELALLLIEVGASDAHQKQQTTAAAAAGAGSGGVHASEAAAAGAAFALAAVQGYAAAAEAAVAVSNAVAMTCAALRPRQPSSSGRDGAAAASAVLQQQQEQQEWWQQRQMDRAKCDRLQQQQQQQHQVLHHRSSLSAPLPASLLLACPVLAELPPELAATRWHSLLSGLLGQKEAAAALATASPFLLADYADLPGHDTARSGAALEGILFAATT